MNPASHPMSSPFSQQRGSYSVQEQQRAIYTSPIMSPERQQSVPRGLGLYHSTMAPHQPTVTLVASPQQGAWTQAPALEHEYVTSQPPDIFSAAIDPFSGWHANPQGMTDPHSPEAPGLDFCHTPSSSNMPSHRGSVSSYAPSDGSERAYTPGTKTDEEWYPSATNEHILQRGSTANSLQCAPGSAPLQPHPQDMYRQQHEEIYATQSTEWSKNDTVAYLSELRTSPDGRKPRFESNNNNNNSNSTVAGVGRIKKKRQRTTPEEATHDCKICGKLFKRSYNWKSHMETHNPERKYPHPCTAMAGDQPCTKKFQRKTDLDRHFDSVHLKARNHKCPLCGNKFARRDTLRRHTEDGCPKRFELRRRETSVTTQQAPQSARWPSSSPIPPNQHMHVLPRSKSFSGSIPQSTPVLSPAAGYPMYSQTMSLPTPPAY